MYPPVAPLGMLSLGVLSKHKDEGGGGLHDGSQQGGGGAGGPGIIASQGELLWDFVICDADLFICCNYSSSCLGVADVY